MFPSNLTVQLEDLLAIVKILFHSSILLQKMTINLQQKETTFEFKDSTFVKYGYSIEAGWQPISWTHSSLIEKTLKEQGIIL